MDFLAIVVGEGQGVRRVGEMENIHAGKDRQCIDLSGVGLVPRLVEHDAGGVFHIGEGGGGRNGRGR